MQIVEFMVPLCCGKCEEKVMEELESVQGEKLLSILSRSAIVKRSQMTNENNVVHRLRSCIIYLLLSTVTRLWELLTVQVCTRWCVINTTKE